MRRLYVQIWLSFLAIGVGSLVCSGILALLLVGPHTDFPEDAPVTVFEADGTLVSNTAIEPLPFGEPGPFHTFEAVGVRFRLPDGRILVAGRPADVPRRARFFLWLASFAGIVALGCYPLARRITRRLEHVQKGLVRWGEGDLAARVPVRGKDEVAAVARTFNEAADRVQALFDAQRRVLASASHELRSPLARLRMAIELLDEGRQSDIARSAAKDVEELDVTVGDLLQVGRMQALDGPEHPEPVALRGLLREEAERVGAEAHGPDTVVHGDPRLLRRLARNLLENARRHGAPPITATVTAHGFVVSDRGPGVPEELRERIFEPFFRPAGHAEGKDGGVGLGLHLAREIAVHHGGSVRCEPEDGGGTRFVVLLG